MSEEEHLFIVDTSLGMSSFNRLKMYDSIDWSKTANLRIELQGRSLRVQGVESPELNDIHICEDGENMLAISTLAKTG